MLRQTDVCTQCCLNQNEVRSKTRGARRHSLPAGRHIFMSEQKGPVSNDRSVMLRSRNVKQHRSWVGGATAVARHRKIFQHYEDLEAVGVGDVLKKSKPFNN